MNEDLSIDGNTRNIGGGVTDDANQYIRRFRIDDASKGLKVMIVGGAGSGTVTAITQSTGILLTPNPITTTGTVGLATNIAPIATLGSALQSIRVNAGGTALEYYTPAAAGITIGTTTITSGTNTRILYDNAGVVGEYTLTGSGTVVAMQTAPSFLTSITTPSVLASANDSGALGASGTAFSDLYLASGGVINWNAGNVGITHNNAGTFILVNPGDLRITSANVGTNADSVPTLSSTSTLTSKTITASSNVLGGVTMTLGSDASYDMYYRSAGGVLTRLANGTTGQILTATTNNAPSWGAGTTVGYTVQLALGAFNPADSVSYFVYPSGVAQASAGTEGLGRLYIPKAGTIKVVYVGFSTDSPSSNETSTITVRLNNTTDTTISSAVTNDATNTVFSNTGLSIAVAQGDYIELKWTTPAWSSNPTNVRISATVYIE